MIKLPSSLDEQPGLINPHVRNARLAGMTTERSSLGHAYREQLARDAIPIDDLTREVREDRLLRICFPREVLPAPVFLSAAERTGLLRDVGMVYRLLTELPERL
jgi:hypothetical protein